MLEPTRLSGAIPLLGSDSSPGCNAFSNLIPYSSAIRFNELKGRGIAVFRCAGQAPVSEICSAPGSLIVDAASPVRVDAGRRPERIIVPDVPASLLEKPESVRSLVNRVILPAFHQRIPLYFTTDAALSCLAPTAAPFGDSKVILQAMNQLAGEQLGRLLERTCALLPGPEAFARLEADGLPPMTPIEIGLYKAMVGLSLPVTAQVPVGPYIVDFLLRGSNGTLVVVEVDGRLFHDAERDAVRDRDLREHHGIQEVIRFSGARTWRDADQCTVRVTPAPWQG
jgi:hypothetical protein